MKYTKGLVYILILAQIAIVSYLIYTSYFGISPICFSGQGCKIVKDSPYSSIFGISLNYFGFISLSLLFIAHILHHKKKIPHYIFPLMTSIGAIFAIYFLSLQFFVIRSLCSSCLAIDITMIIVLALVLYDCRKDKML